MAGKIPLSEGFYYDKKTKTMATPAHTPAGYSVARNAETTRAYKAK